MVDDDIEWSQLNSSNKIGAEWEVDSRVSNIKGVSERVLMR